MTQVALILTDTKNPIPHHYRDLDAESAQEATRLLGLASTGDAHAQSSLGVLYEFGDGVDQDDLQADMWYSLAAAHGIDIAAKNRDDLEKKMAPTQIAQAKKLASEWKPVGAGATATPAGSTSPTTGVSQPMAPASAGPSSSPPGIGPV